MISPVISLSSKEWESGLKGMSTTNLRLQATGRRWNRASGGGKHWWTNDRLKWHMNQAISSHGEGGVVGALAALANTGSAGRAVSVGCGRGEKERALIKAGLVDRFDLFEASDVRADQAKRGAEQEGMGDRVDVFVEDAFRHPAHGRYDLVYWDHSLHHMLDVDKAISWSVTALKPGGLLVVNDYVGPSRLQWTRREVDYARKFLIDNRDVIDGPPGQVRHSNIISRLRQVWRDFSEAPQSHLIEERFERHCGARLRPLGGAMFHLCARFVAHLDQDHPIYDRLVAWDRHVLDAGITHFAFGTWRK